MDSEPSWSEEKVRRALATQGFPVWGALPPRNRFGTGTAMADRLVEMVGRGAQTATSSLLWEVEAEGSALPRPGEREIVVDGKGEPQAVIEVAEVRVLPFEEVDAEFGRDPDPRMPIVCVQFRIRILHAAPEPG